MTLHDLLAAIGVDPTVLYAGTGGGILRALSRQRIRLREILVSPPCGGSCRRLSHAADRALCPGRWPATTGR